MNIFDEVKKRQVSIRLESIGGLGANLIGSLLGEMAVSHLHLNAASFSSYGSEKRGSPVRSYIRLCDEHEEIKENTPILKPDILVLFHKAMLSNDQVLEGIDEHTVLILNSAEDEPVDLDVSAADVKTVDATAIALNTNGKTNMVMLAAIFKELGIDLELGRQLITATLGKKKPSRLEGNLKTFAAGYEGIRSLGVRRSSPAAKRSKPSLGYGNMPLGGIITEAGNIITHDLSASRTGMVPQFLPDRCIHCGLCDITCPDMVFQFALGEYKGLERMINQGMDIAHCKGCMRCVQICPVDALKPVREYELDRSVVRANKDCLIKDPIREYVGSNSWMSSESEFVEKNILKEN